MKYKIWDKKESLILPNGKVYAPEEVMLPENYGWTKYCEAVLLGYAGQITYEISNFDAIRESEGLTDGDPQEALDRYLQEREKPQAEPEIEPSPEERIAAALEYQNLVNMQTEV